MTPSITPVATEPADPDAELAASDSLDGRVTIDVGEASPPPLGRTPAYDFAERAFIPGQAGGPLTITGTATLAQWIEKCLQTRQGENPAVDPAFGVTVLAEDLIDGGTLDDSALGEAYEDWERALLLHPRISEVSSITVATDFDVDYVLLTVTVVADGLDDPLTITDLAIRGGENPYG